MATLTSGVITDSALTTLQFISSYRYLSVNQVATVTGLKPKSASELLLRLERRRLLASFGNTGIRGYGKTPKVYYLTKAGHHVLAEECGHLGIDVEPYRQININSRWSPMMYHRLATLDVMMALERDCRPLPHYQLVKTLVEYRRERANNQWRRETTDYVAKPETSENRIVPDAGFVLENTASGQRALFLIEVDCGTEQLTTLQTSAIPQTFGHKINQYDRYVASKRVTDRYKTWGDFSYFTLLVITDSESRVQNMRSALKTDNSSLYRFYRFSTLEAVTENFLHDKWLSRDRADHQPYRLIRGA